MTKTPSAIKDSPDEPREGVILTAAEWDEIESCSIAFHAALGVCDPSESGETGELVKSVYLRFSRCLSAIRERRSDEDHDTTSTTQNSRHEHQNRSFLPPSLVRRRGDGGVPDVVFAGSHDRGTGGHWI